MIEVHEKYSTQISSDLILMKKLEVKEAQTEKNKIDFQKETNALRDEIEKLNQ